jgi:hypothetical protein
MTIKGIAIAFDGDEKIYSRRIDRAPEIERGLELEVGCCRCTGEGVDIVIFLFLLCFDLFDLFFLLF